MDSKVGPADPPPERLLQIHYCYYYCYSCYYCDYYCYCYYYYCKNH